MSLAHSLLAHSPPGYVGLHQLHHVEGGLVQTHKYAIVDLTQTKKLENLADAWTDTIDTKPAKKT